jgi:hypothetical protein
LPGFENKSGQLRAFKNNSLRAIARIAHFYYYLVGGNLKGLKHMFFHVLCFPSQREVKTGQTGQLQESTLSVACKALIILVFLPRHLK